MQRREAITRAAALFGLAAARPAHAALPDSALRERDPERYWARIREEQFLLPSWRAFLNNGSLGVAPKPVVHAVADFLQRGASLLSDEYPRWGYETLDAERKELSGFLGCDPDELAIVHNATEAMSVIANGLDLRAGDEVLITDQEHPSGRGCWLLRQARHGVAVREAKLPLLPASPAELRDALLGAIGPKTRVFSFSGILTSTGMVLPVREICDEARRRGVLTVVDGAHMVGQMPFRLDELGCDFFAGSPHKWLFAPAGSGLLWLRREHLDRLWPVIVTGNWDQIQQLKAARYMMVGTNNRAVVEGMMAGLRFQQSLGAQAVYARIHQLARQVREQAAAIPYLELITPAHDLMYAAMVSVRFRGVDPTPFLAACRKERIWISFGDRLRISTHIHTRPSDIDLLFRTMRKTLG